MPFGVPNGKKCFTCVNTDCTGTVNCAGDEDQCISTKGETCSHVSPALQCYQCNPDAFGTCTTTQTSCPDQCASKTYLISYGDQQQQISVKDCTASEECISGSLNLGVTKTSLNTKCCSTDLCNSQTLPVTSAGAQVTVKGCASRSVCTASASSLQAAGITGNVSCCEGDLCNGGTDVKLSLLIMPVSSALLLRSLSSLQLKHIKLQCYQCIPGLNGTCTDTQTFCSDQCGSATVLVSADGQEKERKVKDCAATEECVNGSLNLGFVKTTINTKCCNTDLCNNQTVPALAFGAPNGKKCFTCINNDCRGTVNCAGDEDRCISSEVQCYMCQIGSQNDTCTDFKTDCPDQCISITTFMSTDGQELQQSVKGCAAPEMCIRESINLGVWKFNNNAKCCSTDLCTVQQWET
ncbi:hypothetical protein NFI96_030830 [Prochilodus magdalenae]|nr:hypothetical protein NFI96_030830 [Prochilodus magdalenae]